MKPEPPLDMFPNRPDVWYAGVEACQRGLPITFDHPYCCGLKDVWEAGWKAAAGERPADVSMSMGYSMPVGLRGEPLKAWCLGVFAAQSGRGCETNPFKAGNLHGAWKDGWEAYRSESEANPEYKASDYAGTVRFKMEQIPTTTQDLIDAWRKARNALREHVWKMLPYDCAVAVDNERYKGPGIVRGYPSDDLSKVEVKIPNGNTWHYPVTSVRRVE